MKNPGEMIRERYKVLELIDKSKIGHIYKVLDQTENREVALKMLEAESTSDSDVVKRVIKEGEVLAHLRHPAIVQFYSLEMEGRTPFLVMEYIQGRTMKDLKDDLRKDLPRLFNLFLQILEGVEVCHQAGVFHRHISPENLLITKEGQLKIIDFRLAKTREKLTRPGELLDISEYMAPEQCQGQKITEAADIFSVGVVIWEFLTGEVPFPLEASNKPVNIQTLMAMVKQPLPIEKFDALPRFAGLRNLMQRILDKDAKFRPSLQEIVSVLKQEMPAILAAAPNPA